MRLRRALTLLAFALLPVPLAAQSFNLRDLLTDFIKNGITLAPPPRAFRATKRTSSATRLWLLSRR